MTSKVVELRQRLMDGRGFLTGTVSVLDLLISAAHAEGVVEGAEQERERIRKVAEFTTANNPILNGPLVSASSRVAYGTQYVARAREQNIAIIPASVLAPTKESEK